MNGPSAHLAWPEIACHDAGRTPYPYSWRNDRAVALGENFEAVREILGGFPLVILSGYRTAEYNSTLEGAASKSQHVQGLALDISHPVHAPRVVWKLIHEAFLMGDLPLLGGLGIYPTFCHIDIRAKVPRGHLATWAGRGATIPV